MSHLVFRERPNRYDIATAKPLDPLTRAIHGLLLNAIRDGVTEIRFVPNERNLRAYMLVTDTLQEWYSPFLKATAGPIARLLKKMLRGDLLGRDDEAAMEGTIYVGEHPLHVSLTTTPTEYGDLLTLRIVDPSGGVDTTDDSGISLGDAEGMAEDGDHPAPPASTPTEEEIREASREILGCLNPAIYDVTDG